ncbi:DUF559 domain-containing protein [Agromyces lapidis]|uniref:DUF559 domain-containing protein n=1 Tax=Agromyces lapidis TaxID=279574 RepID=A0ABV5SN44_9MICO|nr:DUF559 domain-containing protein [Agromyces lapidis]
MRLHDWLEANGRIRHVEEAVAAGFTRYAVRGAIARKEVGRIRRSWLALPGAPFDLRRAAQVSGRLGCLSAARHHGLWTLDDGRRHLCVPRNASRFDPRDDVVHWGHGPIRPHRFELVDPVVNALIDIADCQPLDSALATWESALRTGAVSVGLLRQLPMRSSAAQRIRRGASQLSDSGIESIPYARLCRSGLAVEQQVRLDGHPVDLLVEGCVVVQVDGYEFHRSKGQRQRDIAQDRRLVLMGFVVFRYDYETVLYDWETIEREVRTAVAVAAVR